MGITDGPVRLMETTGDLGILCEGLDRPMHFVCNTGWPGGLEGASWVRCTTGRVRGGQGCVLVSMGSCLVSRGGV